MPPLLEGLDGAEYHVQIVPGSLLRFSGALRSSAESAEQLSQSFSRKVTDAFNVSLYLILTVDSSTYALFQETGGYLALFDSHARDRHGKLSSLCFATSSSFIQF